MKKEQKITILTMILNLMVASVKLISGIMFGFSILIADSLQSFIDFLTDIIAMIASKIGKRRANKKYPFGYGMIEHISNFIIGIILLLVAIYIFVSSFGVHEVVLSKTVFMILIIAIVLKLISIGILYYYGKKLKSNSLMNSVKESLLDLMATLIVLIVSILLKFKDIYPMLEYANVVGSVIISLIICYTAMKIIVENIRYLLGINEDNVVVKEKLEKIIKGSNLVKDFEIKLMKLGTYYHLYLTIEVDISVTLKELFALKKKLKNKIKESDLNIKFVEIEPKEFD